MTIVYDHTVTNARLLVRAHQPTTRPDTRCTAGCDRWPCVPFTRAWALATGNSNARVMRAAASRS